MASSIGLSMDYSIALPTKGIRITCRMSSNTTVPLEGKFLKFSSKRRYLLVMFVVRLPPLREVFSPAQVLSIAQRSLITWVTTYTSPT